MSFSLYFLASVPEEEKTPEPGSVEAHRYLWNFPGTTLDVSLVFLARRQKTHENGAGSKPKAQSHQQWVSGRWTSAVDCGQPHWGADAQLWHRKRGRAKVPPRESATGRRQARLWALFDIGFGGIWHGHDTGPRDRNGNGTKTHVKSFNLIPFWKGECTSFCKLFFNILGVKTQGFNTFQFVLVHSRYARNVLYLGLLFPAPKLDGTFYWDPFLFCPKASFPLEIFQCGQAGRLRSCGLLSSWRGRDLQRAGHGGGEVSEPSLKENEWLEWGLDSPEKPLD